MATKFLKGAFGPQSWIPWAVAGGGAYLVWYRPEQLKKEEEANRATNAARLMQEAKYVDFVEQHDAGPAKKSGGGWFGGWFGGGGGSTQKKPEEPTKK